MSSIIPKKDGRRTSLVGEGPEGQPLRWGRDMCSKRYKVITCQAWLRTKERIVEVYMSIARAKPKIKWGWGRKSNKSRRQKIRKQPHDQVTAREGDQSEWENQDTIPVPREDQQAKGSCYTYGEKTDVPKKKTAAKQKKNKLTTRSGINHKQVRECPRKKKRGAFPLKRKTFAQWG